MADIAILHALEACRDYFEGRADAEYFTDRASPVGNEEMRMLVLIDMALKKERNRA